LRWLGRQLRKAVHWVAKLLRAPLRPLARTPPWKLARAGLRLLGQALVWRRRPETKRGFGFWWLVVTLVIAVAVGLVVAALLTPVAGILAFLVVGIWALVRRLGSRGDDRDDERPDADDRIEHVVPRARRRAARRRGRRGATDATAGPQTPLPATG
jgi:hypothetical protein